MHHNERFQNNYDFLRLFAACSIMFYHSFSLLRKIHEEPVYELTNGRINFGFVGLSIFFCISGYLIAKSAVRSPTIINYLWKRLLRVQPLLIITCILTVFICVFFTNFSAKDYFLNPGTWSYFRNVMPVFGLQFTLPGVFVHNIAENGVNGSLWTLILE
ncbi:MAG: acyltransferase family protein, partial [Ginsengibacter sp.]